MTVLSSAFPAGPRRTPARWVAQAVALAWWLAQPALAWRYYAEQLGRGAYPPDADSIGIPIAVATCAWLLVTPAVLAALWLGFRRYRPGLSYTALDPERALLGAAWTLAVLVAAAPVLSTAYADAAEGYPWLAAAQLPGVLALAWLRSSLAAPPRGDGSARTVAAAPAAAARS